MSISPEQLQEIIDRLPTVLSLRQLATEIGVEKTALRQIIRPFVAVMRASGALPDCPCGKPRFHLYGCTATRGSIKGFGASGEIVAHQRMIIGLMLDGVPIKHIARMLALSPTSIRHYKRHMTEDERARLVEIQNRRVEDRRPTSPRTRKRASLGQPRVPRPVNPVLIAALIEGRSYRDIRDTLGFAQSTIGRAVQKLTPEQKAQRERRISESCFRTKNGWAPKRDRGAARFPAKHLDPAPQPWRLAA